MACTFIHHVKHFVECWSVRELFKCNGECSQMILFNNILIACSLLLFMNNNICYDHHYLELDRQFQLSFYELILNIKQSICSRKVWWTA